jgi:hypothetical protein
MTFNYSHGNPRQGPVAFDDGKPCAGAGHRSRSRHGMASRPQQAWHGIEAVAAAADFVGHALNHRGELGARPPPLQTGPKNQAWSDLVLAGFGSDRHRSRIKETLHCPD